MKTYAGLPPIDSNDVIPLFFFVSIVFEIFFQKLVLHKPLQISTKSFCRYKTITPP
jgi:hypothetical protein